MTIQAWLENAIADARRRGLPELEPLLETMARSTESLRKADDERRPMETFGRADEQERQ